ncbi:MAG TPA: carboxypeptidase-like regulatory domain-containing protein, partial [Pedobacter sp.]
MKNIYLTIFLVINALGLSAQQLKLTGTIKDTEGEPVPFASIYIKNTTKGTSANVDGIYGLALEKGTYTIIYRAIGYKSKEQTISIDASHTENVVLSPEAYSLSGVTIDGNAEDPAYEIIRQAI